MITVDMSLGALARVRIAPSPAKEILSWFELTVAGRCHPVFGDPGPAARFALRDPDVALLAQTVRAGRGGYKPDLLTPKPGTRPWHDTLAEQLETLRQMSHQTVVDQVVTPLEPNGLAVAVLRSVDDGTFARRAAAGLDRFWQAAVAGEDRVLTDVMDADIGERARTIARFGIGQLLATLHPRITWAGGRMAIDKPYEEHSDLGDAELVLAPTVLGWPALTVQVVHDMDQAVVAYPVRSPSADRRRPAGGLAGLLGASRAAILRDLDTGRSTLDLSRRLNLAPSTVSHHLTVLLGAGMVQRARKGVTVQYRRSDQGEALVN